MGIFFIKSFLSVISNLRPIAYTPPETVISRNKDKPKIKPSNKNIATLCDCEKTPPQMLIASLRNTASSTTTNEVKIIAKRMAIGINGRSSFIMFATFFKTFTGFCFIELIESLLN